MKLIVGLGNPGDNYSLTKHNFGFWIIDKLVKQSSLKYKDADLYRPMPMIMKVDLKIELCFLF